MTTNTSSRYNRPESFVWLIVGSAIALLVMAGCAGFQSEVAPAEVPEAEPETVLTISGSGTTTRVLTAVKPAFETDTPGYTLEILSGTGTGGGVEGAMQGVLDVAAMARPPKEEETAQGLEYTEFGNAGVALFIHPDVGVTDLTTEQAAMLFAGEVTNWAEFDGPDLEVVLYTRDEGESSTKALREAIFGDTPFPETTAQVLTSAGDMLTAVEGTPGSVGFGNWPTVPATGASIEAIALDGIAPSDGAYSLTTPLGIGYLAERQEDVQPLIDWLLSEQGKTALQELDVIPVE